MAERPVVRWDAAQASLVGENGRPVTDAQEAKARKILELGLLRFAGLRDIESGVRAVSEYECAPLPGCKQLHVLVHTKTLEDGVARDSFSCDCQAARGTRASRPRACSHMLALSRLIHGRSAQAA